MGRVVRGRGRRRNRLLVARMSEATSGMLHHRRGIMRGLRIFGACAVIIALALSNGSAFAQKSIKDQLVGTWLLVAVTAERADGSKGEPFGANPKGVIIFTADGHFSLLQMRA